MRFGRTDEQLAFAEALDSLLAAADVSSVARQWAAEAPEAGLELWGQLAEVGVSGLLVPETHGGLGASVVDLAVAFERLGFHGVPGPWIETAALGPLVLSAAGDPDGLLAGVAEGKVVLTLAAPPGQPFALDAQVCTHRLLLEEDVVWEADVATTYASVDPTRRPARLEARRPVATLAASARAAALDVASLAAAAQLIGLGQRMLDDSVAYVGMRRQFGRAVGEYQAVKHLLADVKVAVDFAAPLVHGAALSVDHASPSAARDVSAAKVAASDAAWLAARTALQVHGAIGYTLEHDLSLFLTRTRALAGSWGTAAWHRTRVLAELTSGRS